MTRPAELCETDFAAWTQDQAAVLRTRFRDDHRLDVEHLAEELWEDARTMAAASSDAELDPGKRSPKQRPYDRDATTQREVMVEVGLGLSGGDDASRMRRGRGKA